MISAFVNLNKEKGMTSAKAVAKVKRILSDKGLPTLKTGHMGTLDPDGEGVLPVAVGRATRLFDYVTGDKIYYTEFVFGKTTDTLDASGNFSDVTGPVPDYDALRSVIPSLTGKISQIPPKYSAKSVNGRRAYDLARAGEEFELKPKQIEIYSIDYLGRADEAFAFRVSCSGGTYIRSLCRDMAEKAGTVGYMLLIRREKCGVFEYKDAVTLDTLRAADDIGKYLIPIESALSYLPVYELNGNPEGARLILNGVPLRLSGMPDSLFRLNIDGNLFGLGRKDMDGRFQWAVRLT